MILYLDPDFQRKLDEFNAAKGGPARIEVSWEPKLERWRIFVVPIYDSSHPLAKNSHTTKMLRPFPDGSGRWGVPLNLWQGPKGEFLPMDDRLFEAINFADSFRSREHFEETVDGPEAKKEQALKARVKELAYHARSYWFGLDRLVKSMNPNVSSSGDWRWRNR